nr:hypothetical protein [uncultured organism]
MTYDQRNQEHQNLNISCIRIRPFHCTTQKRQSYIPLLIYATQTKKSSSKPIPNTPSPMLYVLRPSIHTILYCTVPQRIQQQQKERKNVGIHDMTSSHLTISLRFAILISITPDTHTLFSNTKTKYSTSGSQKRTRNSFYSPSYR